MHYPPMPDGGGSPLGRRGKRLAVISAATAGAFAVAAVAVVAATGGGKGQVGAQGSARVGDPLSGVDPGNGALPGSSGASGGGPGADGGDSASSGGSAAAGPGAPTSTGSARNPSGPPSSSQASHSGSSAPHTSKSSASKTTSRPASSTKSAPPPPAHKPPAPLSSGEVKVNIPDWYLVAGIDVTWNAHSDATGYVVHFTESDGTDEHISIPDNWYSYQIDKGLTTCLQVKAVNQYGESAYTPMQCVDPASHQIH